MSDQRLPRLRTPTPTGGAMMASSPHSSEKKNKFLRDHRETLSSSALMKQQSAYNPSLLSAQQRIQSEKSTTQFRREGQTVDLKFMGLKCVPSHVVLLSGVRVLNLHGNELSFLPEDLADGLANLTTLDISKNLFTRFPREICDLRELTSLLMQDNMLRMILPQVGDLSLKTLNIMNNEINSLPLELSGCLSSLTCLATGGKYPLIFPPEQVQAAGVKTMLKYMLDVRLAQGHCLDTGVLDLSGIPYSCPCYFLQTSPGTAGAVSRPGSSQSMISTVSGGSSGKRDYMIHDHIAPLLEHLTALDMTDTNLRLLPDMNLFPHLVHLIADANSLSAVKIPSLQNLQVVSLRDNHIQSIQWLPVPPPSLLVLQIDGNIMAALPDLDGAVSLTFLSATRNKIVSVGVKALAGPKLLRRLLLQDNIISGLDVPNKRLGNITELDLTNNRLQSLPPSLFSLVSIQRLMIDNNEITELPELLSQLTQLTELSISGCAVKRLPAAWGYLANLQTFLHDRTNLRIPPKKVLADGLAAGQRFIRMVSESVSGSLMLNGFGIQKLSKGILVSNITELNLDENVFTALPESISKLAGLKVLSIAKNKLNQLPFYLSELPLVSLNFHGNELSLLPDWIGLCTSLKLLDISKNNIRSLPTSMRHLTMLTQLNIDTQLIQFPPKKVTEEGLAGIISFFKSAFNSKPGVVDLRSKGMVTLHTEATTTANTGSNLETLLADHNALSSAPSSIPEEAFSPHTPFLTHLSLSFNRLMQVPNAIFVLTNLVYLNLRSTLIDTIPPFVRYFRRLQTFDIGRNEVRQLPHELSELEEMKVLLCDNNLFAECPSPIFHNDNAALPLSFTLGPLSLELLVLSYNDIGLVPHSLTRLTRLSALHLDSNRISTMPSGFPNLTTLTDLRLHNNPIVGLPVDIGSRFPKINLTISIESMQYPPRGVLRQGANNILRYLHAQYSAEFSNTLDLSDMLLSTLPGRMMRATALRAIKVLKMDNCDLGEVPNDLGHFEYLETLSLEDNRILDIPFSVVNLDRIESLYFAGNNIGSLSVLLGSIPSLTFVDVRQNPCTFPPLFVTSRGGRATHQFLKSLSFARQTRTLDLGDSLSSKVPPVSTPAAPPTHTAPVMVEIPTPTTHTAPASVGGLTSSTHTTPVTIGVRTPSTHTAPSEVETSLISVAPTPTAAAAARVIVDIQTPVTFREQEQLFSSQRTPGGDLFAAGLVAEDLESVTEKDIEVSLQVMRGEIPSDQKFSAGEEDPGVGSVVKIGDDLAEKAQTIDWSFISGLEWLTRHVDRKVAVTPKLISDSLCVLRKSKQMVKVRKRPTAVENRVQIDPDTMTQLFTLSLAHNKIEDVSFNALLSAGEKNGNLLINLTDLCLTANFLSSLPPQFSLCTSLRILDISKNLFQNFPNPILKLSTLEVLDVQDNPLKSLSMKIGFLPYLKTMNANCYDVAEPSAEIISLGSEALIKYFKDFARAFSSRTMSLKENGLTKVPTEISMINTLAALDISGNAIASLEPTLPLGEITTLIASRNQLSVLPMNIGRLQTLTHLDLKRNTLRDLPDSFASLVSLLNLNISHNDLELLPPAVFLLSRLERLAASHNRINELSERVGQLVSLVELHLVRNNIKVIPIQFGACTSLEKLTITENPVVSPPLSLIFNQRKNKTFKGDSFTPVQYGIEAGRSLIRILYSASTPETALENTLDLSGFQLTDIPEEVYSMVHLVTLSVAECGLERVSPRITELSNLKSLILSSNKIVRLPLQMGSMTHLRLLDIGENPLKTPPTAVAVLGSQYSLNFLQKLRGFSESGSITLERFHLRKIPREIFDNEGALFLTLAHNDIVAVSPKIELLKNLRELVLDFNSLTSLPEGLCRLVYLKRLSLESNRLKALPQTIEEMTSLMDLNVKFNELETLPEGIGFCLGLHSLLLEGNPLSFPPVEVQALGGQTCAKFVRQIATSSFTRVLDISNFHLKQMPVDWLAHAESLTILNMDSNQLTQLPKEISRLSNLTVLSIQRNKIATLPSEVMLMPYLRDLRTFGNPLEGVQANTLEHHQEIRFEDQTVVHNAEAGRAVPVSEQARLKPLRLLGASSRVDQFSLQRTAPPKDDRRRPPTMLKEEPRHEAKNIVSPPLVPAHPPSFSPKNLDLKEGEERMRKSSISLLLSRRTSLASESPSHSPTSKDNKDPSRRGSDLYPPTAPPAVEVNPLEIGAVGAVEDLSGSEHVRALPLLDILRRLQAVQDNLVDLSSLHLTIVPPVVTDMNSITSLSLKNNNLQALPADIGKLKYLKFLDCGSNKLEGLPVTIGHLSQLSVFRLQFNCLKALPHQIGKLHSLATLGLFGNPDLRWLPLCMSSCTSLVELFIDVFPDKWVFPPVPIMEASVRPHAQGVSDVSGADIGGDFDDSVVSFPPAISAEGVLLGEAQTLTNYLREYQQRLIDVSKDANVVEASLSAAMDPYHVLDLSGMKLAAPFLPPLPKMHELDRDIFIVGVDPEMVHKLLLSSNVIKSTFETLALFSNLKYLCLSDNFVMGYGPGLKECRKLESLILSGNSLEDIPMIVCELSWLRRLDLSRNNLVTIGPALAGLAGLVELNFQKNKLSSISTEIFSLSISSFLIDDNPLKEMPDELCLMTQLKTLSVCGTLLHSLPADLGKISTLRELRALACPRLKALPLSLGRCKQLQILDIDPKIVHVPPREVYAKGVDAVSTYLGGLEQWNLGDRDHDLSMQGMGVTLLALSVLPWLKPKGLQLNDNGIKNLNLSDAQWELMKSIRLRRNSLSSLPIMTSRTLTSLVTLDLGENQFSIFPQTLSWMQGLTYLNLERNFLTEIPESVSRLKKVQRLLLSENQIAEIPDALFMCSAIIQLDLRTNLLRIFPRTVVQLPELQILQLSGNAISHVHASVCECSNLVELDLDFPNVDTIPVEIWSRGVSLIKSYLRRVSDAMGEYRKLEMIGLGLLSLPFFSPSYYKILHLNLDENSLSALPLWVSHLTLLQSLSAAKNKITDISEEISVNLTNLTRLNLASNFISVVPVSFSLSPALTNIHLHDNPLLSPPEQLCAQGSESILNFMKNLIGEKSFAVLNGLSLKSVPQCFVSIHTHIVSLDLSFNFIESLPANLPVSLEILNFQSNKLKSLEDRIDHLTNLRVLDVSFNEDLHILPLAVGILPSLKTVKVTSATIRSPPPELLLEGLKLLREYFSRVDEMKNFKAIGQTAILNLSNLGLKSIPSDVFMAEPHTLNLTQNPISNVTGRLEALHTLMVLDISRTDITSLPETFTSLFRLQIFKSTHNRWAEVSPMVYQLTRLNQLDLSNNNISVCEGLLQSLSFLSSLNISHNSISTFPNLIYVDTTRDEQWESIQSAGKTPMKNTAVSVVRCARTLTEIDASYNRISAIENEFSSCVNLTSLEFKHNRVKFIPNALSCLQNLKYFGIEDNALEDISAWMINVPDVRVANNPLPPALKQALDANTWIKVLDRCNACWYTQKADLSMCSISHLPPSLLRNPTATYLNMSQNPIYNFPTGLGQLCSLMTLVMFQSKLEKVSTEIGYLTQLTELDLNNNDIGQLPDEICNCVSLVSLHIENNVLVTLPERFNSLSNLQYLHLHNNRLRSLPQQMDQLTKMVTLDFSNNVVIALPGSISSWSNLEILNATNNRLESVSALSSAQSRLTTLSLGNNKIQHLPLGIAVLPALTSLQVHDNPLSSTTLRILEKFLVPGLIRYFAALIYPQQQQKKREIQRRNLEDPDELTLTLNDFEFQEFPEDVIGLFGGLGDQHCRRIVRQLGIEPLSAIQVLDVSQNSLSRIPDLSYLPHLHTLIARNNRLWAIDDMNSMLTTLTKLDLTRNMLETVPKCVVALHRLKHLFLKDNPLRFLPLKQWRTARFETLHLNNEVSIPAPHLGPSAQCLVPIEVREVGKVGEENYIRVLTMAARTFSLDISELGLYYLPTQALEILGLKELYMSGNFIRNIPAEIQTLAASLTVLVLNANCIKNICPEIGTLTKLERLSITANKIEILPPELGMLERLEALDTNDNPLRIPHIDIASASSHHTKVYLKALMECRAEGRLDLSGMELTDKQFTIEDDSNLRVLQLLLRHNNLSRLPANVSNILNLQSLDVSHNTLVALPLTLSLLTRLESIDLNHNKFIAYPGILYEMPWVRRVAISHNKLRILPPEIALQASLQVLSAPRNEIISVDPAIIHLTALRDLDISYNPITNLHPDLQRLSGWNPDIVG